MGASAGPDLIDSGLVLALDAADRNSYPGSGATWTDLSGNGNHFTLNNSPTNDGKKFTFNGTNQSAVCNNNTCGDFGSGSVTLEYCVNVTTVPTYGSLVIKRNSITSIGGANRNGWAHRSNVSFFIQDSATARQILSPAIDYFSGISHNVLTFSRSGSNGTMNFYINNILTGTTSGSFSGDGNISNTSNMNIFYTPGENVYTAGDVYFVRIYDRALTATEIQQNFNALRSRFFI